MKAIPIPAAAVAALLSGSGAGRMLPQVAVVNDGERRVLQIGPWTSNAIPDPSAVAYAGASGLTGSIAEAADLRGPATISTLGSTADPSATLTLDPTSGDVFQVTGP